MNKWFLIDFKGDERHGYIAGSRLSPTDLAYSTLVDIGFNRQADVWQDDSAHYHTLPTTNPAYSPLWDFWSGWQRSLITWHGQEFHYHTHAEEYYIVLRGRLDLEVDSQVVSVQPGYLLGVKPGAVHGVIGGQEPIDTFFFRAPGGRGDKTVVGSR